MTVALFIQKLLFKVISHPAAGNQCRQEHMAIPVICFLSGYNLHYKPTTSQCLADTSHTSDCFWESDTCNDKQESIWFCSFEKSLGGKWSFFLIKREVIFSVVEPNPFLITQAVFKRSIMFPWDTANGAGFLDRFFKTYCLIKSGSLSESCAYMLTYSGGKRTQLSYLS